MTGATRRTSGISARSPWQHDRAAAEHDEARRAALDRADSTAELDAHREAAKAHVAAAGAHRSASRALEISPGSITAMRASKKARLATEYATLADKYAKCCEPCAAQAAFRSAKRLEQEADSAMLDAGS